MKVRVKFRKYGPVRFIGHLDVMRFFQKCIRRAGIDVAYTTGYSPHQIMSFAAPLGVGLTSDGEYMDIECNSVTTSRDMTERFNRASVPGIEIVSVVLLPENAGNAMASVAAADYTVRFREGREPSFDYMGKLPDFYAQREILITKETKKNTLTVDIRPGIYELWANPEEREIHMLVDASSGGNIKPSQVMEAYAAWQGETLAENACMVHGRVTIWLHPDSPGSWLLWMPSAARFWSPGQMKRGFCLPGRLTSARLKQWQRPGSSGRKRWRPRRHSSKHGCSPGPRNNRSPGELCNHLKSIRKREERE